MDRRGFLTGGVAAAALGIAGRVEAQITGARLATVLRPSGVVVPVATLAYTAEPVANSVFQRTASTGGGYSKGLGKVVVAISLSFASPVYARTRSAGDGTTIVQTAFLASASATTGNLTVTGLDVPDVVTNSAHGQIYLDLAPTAAGPWTNGTKAFMLGDVTALCYSQSHGEAFITPKEGTGAVSQGITPSNYGWTYGNTTFVTAAATWAKPTTTASLTTVNSAGVMTFLNTRIAARGVATAVVFYAIGSKTIQQMNGAPYNANLKTILAATTGTGASSTGFHEVLIMIGHNDSLNCARPKTFKGLLDIAKADIDSVNTYGGTTKWLIYTVPASNISTSSFTQGRAFDVAAVREAARTWCAVDATNRSYIQVHDAALTDGCHPLNAGMVTVTRAVLRGASNLGPAITSASRSAKDITLTIAHNLGAALVGTGNWWTRFIVASADAQAGRDWSSRFTISSGTIIDATHIKLTLATDPGDGHVLSVRAFPLIDTTNTPGANILRDDYDPESYGYGRALEFTGTVAVNVPLITGATVNAPDTGWVAPVSIRNLTMTSATYTAETGGFVQGLNGGYGVAAGNIQFPAQTITEEFWIDAPSTPASEQYILQFSGNNFRVSEASSGKIQTGGGWGAVAGGSVLTPGTRYHVAFVSDPVNGQSLYVNGTRISTAAAVAAGVIIAPATPSVRANATGIFLFAGTVYEVLVRETVAYSGSSFTAPTAPFADVPADAIAHWRLAGDGVELALAA